VQFVAVADHKHARKLTSYTHGNSGKLYFQTSFVVHSVGIAASFFWVRRPGLVADHSPLSSVKVRNEWRYTSTFPHT
jgi:hypothetical protein